MAPRDEASDTYRKVVSFVYRELGAMRPANHKSLYDKSSIGRADLASDRKERARKVYCETRFESDPHKVEDAYCRVWGLSLEEAREAFRDGDWLLGKDRYTFGGPKWAVIADVAVRLRDAISSRDPDRLSALLHQVPSLPHNNGHLIDKFPQLECP